MSDRVMGIGVGVLLFRNGKILLGKRNEDPEKADSLLKGEGTWTLPGGKLDFGEAFENAAYREVLEETGVRIDLKRLKLVSISNDIVHTAHFVTIGFLAESLEGEAKVMEPEEILEWKWFSPEELPKPLFFPSEKMIKNFTSGKIYSGFTDR
ncbi:MAG: NUDIX domain-containing protein [Candidatus Aenigmatarchaeota archaeon]